MEPSGILIINKPEGMTSHDVVGKVRRLFSTRRVGHTGTLDPMASGVLVILIGRAAKAAEYISSSRKAYVATLRLGTTYDTQDITGTPLKVCSNIPSSDAVISAANKFSGEIMQIPPMYSALKVNGQKLYDLARKGIEVERKPRPITVFSISAEPTESPIDYKLSVECSAGTYIRTLCEDIGNELGCGGAMATLKRTLAGGFDIEHSYTLEEIEALTEENRLSLLHPTKELFCDLEQIRLAPFYERLSRNGCEIYLKKIGRDLPLGERVCLCTQEGEFYALGEVKEYEAGKAIKMIKLFDI